MATAPIAASSTPAHPVGPHDAKEVAVPRATVVAPPPQQPKVDVEAMKAAVNAAARQIESFLRRSQRSIEFTIDATTGRAVATIRDQATGDVIRQIPGEEILRLAQSLHDDSANALVNLMA